MVYMDDNTLNEYNHGGNTVPIKKKKMPVTKRIREMYLPSSMFP
jgi:hypothetical protein